MHQHFIDRFADIQSLALTLALTTKQEQPRDNMQKNHKTLEHNQTNVKQKPV